MMNKQHRFVPAVLTLGLLLGLIGGVLSGARADGAPPRYQHAIADLRYARAWLVAPGAKSAMDSEKDAVKHIEKAIGHLQQASSDDGRDMNYHPPIDANLKHKDRLQKALTLLMAAQKDLFGDEKNKRVLGLRSMAVQHINAAIRANKQAISDSHDAR